MATLQQLQQAYDGAVRAGDMDAARKLKVVIDRELTRREDTPAIAATEQIPDIGSAQVPGTQPQIDPSTSEKLIGVGEAGLTAATGMTTGTLGMLGATLKALAEQILAGKFGTIESADVVEQQALEGLEKFTYVPRTDVGKQYVKNVGETLGPLQALPITAELQAPVKAVQAVGQQAPARTSNLVQRLNETIVRSRQDKQQPSPLAREAAGAAPVVDEALRRQQAENLPAPIKLTKGQAARDYAQLRFEREIAKDPELGEPIRRRLAEQNLQLQQNFDAFIDMVGAELTDLRDIGETINKSIRARAAKDKAKIRQLYKKAEKAGELEVPVVLSDFAQHLQESAPEAEVANVLKAVKKKALQLGAIDEGPNGELTPKPISLKNAELLRRSINAVTDREPTNVRQASIMKKLIDEATEGKGGEAYRAARGARARYARDYENIGLIANLLGTKRGSTDRQIALEEVVRKAVLAPTTPAESTRQLRRILQTAGDDGKQAWKELQGAVLRHIQDQITSNVQVDQAGNRVVSPARLDRLISQLDRSGKLELLYGKKGAEQLRTIRDVAIDVLTTPPGVVNTSNTASVLAGLMDIAISGTAGVPAPVMTSFRLLTKSIRDAKLRAKVKQALGDQ